MSTITPQEGRDRWHRLFQLGLVVGEFAVAPPGWAERRLTLADCEYDAALTEEAAPFVASWEEREPQLWRGDWPSDVAIVQVAGSSKWGAFRDSGWLHGWHPPLIDARFLAALRDAGLTSGWTASPVDVRRRDWQPQATHQALFVDAPAPWKYVADDAHTALTEDDRFFAWTVAPDDIDVGDAAFLSHDNGLFASPAAAAALAAAKLPSFTLKPLIYASELEATWPGSVLDEWEGL